MPIPRDERAPRCPEQCPAPGYAGQQCVHGNGHRGYCETQAPEGFKHGYMWAVEGRHVNPISVNEQAMKNRARPRCPHTAEVAHFRGRRCRNPAGHRGCCETVPEASDKHGFMWWHAEPATNRTEDQ